VENTFVGPFLVLKKLGTNRRHRVYHARQTEQNRDIALKFLSFPSDVEWQAVLDKIEQESVELQKLKHPNLVKIFGAGVHAGQIFLATELVTCESLASVLSRRGKIAPDLVVDYGKQLAEALNYLHSRELVHSKLTPEKILITPEGLVKVADVRINRNKRRRWDTSRLRELDIAAYMAPEQFSEAATAKSDLYALGVMLYEMLTGKLPYDLDNIGRMAKLKSSSPPPSVAHELMGCPIWLDKLVTQMLDPDPRKRPHSAKAVALAMDEIKKMDSSKKSTAAHVLGSFNALNAGIDKSEARALLGKKRKKRESDFSWLQSIPFLTACLLLVVGLLTFLLWPESVAERMERYRAMVNSGNSAKWIEARDALKAERDFNDPKINSQATELYNLARRKILVHRAETGRSPTLQSENIRNFTRAYDLERQEDHFEALAIYRQLAKQIKPSDDEFYVVEEVRPRIERLQSTTVVPESVEGIQNLIEKLASAETIEQLELGNDVLGKILIRLAGEDHDVALRKRVEQVLEENRAKLEKLKTQTPQNRQVAQ
jgi:serine/threonine protein kinase